MAAGIDTPINQIYRTLTELAGVHGLLDRLPGKSGEVQRNAPYVSPRRARTWMISKVQLRDGVRNVLEAYRAASRMPIAPAGR